MSTLATSNTYRLVSGQAHRWKAPLPGGGEIHFGEAVPTEESFGITSSIHHEIRNYTRLDFKAYRSLHVDASEACAIYVVRGVCSDAESIEEVLCASVLFRLYVSERMPYGILMAKIGLRKPQFLPIALDPRLIKDGKNVGFLIESASEVGFYLLCAGGNDFRAGITGKVPAKLLNLWGSTWKAVDPSIPFEDALRLTLEYRDPETLWDFAEDIPAE